MTCTPSSAGRRRSPSWRRGSAAAEEAVSEAVRARTLRVLGSIDVPAHEDGEGASAGELIPCVDPELERAEARATIEPLIGGWTPRPARSCGCAMTRTSPRPTSPLGWACRRYRSRACCGARSISSTRSPLRRPPRSSHREDHKRLVMTGHPVRVHHLLVLQTSKKRREMERQFQMPHVVEIIPDAAPPDRPARRTPGPRTGHRPSRPRLDDLDLVRDRRSGALTGSSI